MLSALRLFLTLALLTTLAGALELHPTRSTATDLALTGLLQGVPAGETRFVRWADLAQLPTTSLKLTGEFVPGEQEVTVVFLADLWKILPVAPGADTLLASCTDGYASVYRDTFIASHRPFLILAINGQGPEKWPPPGLKFNPGPYVISVSATVAPAVAQMLDAGHKKPWGLTTLHVARYTEAFAGILAAPRANLSPHGVAGREIWVHSCASCHAGPPSAFGGTKSERAFDVLVAHARHNPAYFKSYIRDPKGFAASAKMEAHPHYTDDQLDALIAFLVAGSRPE